MPMTILASEDSRLLRWLGHLGHEFVGVCGRLGERHCRCEANSLESAQASFFADDVNPVVYRKISPRKWARAWSQGA